MSRCRGVGGAGLEAEIAGRGGRGVDPLFPAAKIGWLLDTIPGARARAERGELCCGTVDSWLLWNLSGGALHATDPGNASRTQLFNLETQAWDERLAEIFDVPPARSEEHTSELQSLMRISYAVFCLKKKKQNICN